MHNPYSENMKRFLAESIDTLHYVIIPASAYSRKENEQQNALVLCFDTLLGNY